MADSRPRLLPNREVVLVGWIAGALAIGAGLFMPLSGNRLDQFASYILIGAGIALLVIALCASYRRWALITLKVLLLLLGALIVVAIIFGEFGIS
jgi:MFS family permease